MKQTLLMSFFLGCVSICLAAEQYAVVKISGFDKSDVYRIMDSEQLTNFEAVLHEESKLFTRAMSAAKKDWDKDESYKKKRFPTLGKRSMSVMARYSSREDAQEKLYAYIMKDGKLVTTQKPPKAGSPEERKAKSAADRQALYDGAVSMLTAQLSNLSDGKITGAFPGDGGPVVNESGGIKDFKFKMLGTMFHTPGVGWYIMPDKGTLINGVKPYDCTLQGNTPKQFGVDETWFKKEVEASGTVDVVANKWGCLVLQRWVFESLKLLDAEQKPEEKSK